jgi:glycosyltransferase involved in cell wall biosynthesis
MAASWLLESPDPQSPDCPVEEHGHSTVKVLHLINGEHYAGAERVQDLLAGRLGDFGIEVGLACLKPREFPKRRKNRRAPLYDAAMRGRFDLDVVRQLTEIVRGEDYQILHAHTPRTLLVATLVSWRTGLPLVYHVHSPASRETTQRWRNRWNAWIERRCMAFASALIPVSQSLGEHVRRLGIPERKIHVVHNGVPCRPQKPPVRSSQDVWTLGTVALFRPRKGLEVLLGALSTLKSQGEPVRLRAVGGFETAAYEDQIQRQCKALGLADSIVWTGFASDVNAELAQMDVFVLPSLFGEGLPMVVLEAMAAGVPVVASRVEGVPEAIDDGNDGLLVPPGDPQALAGALAGIMHGKVDLAFLGTHAHLRQVEQFSEQSMAQGVATVYRQILGPREK